VDVSIVDVFFSGCCHQWMLSSVDVVISDVVISDYILGMML
jgi:hypothetical protein